MKILKSRILLVIVTIILTGSISVYAAGRYYANQVDYEPSNPNFNVDNMADALDELYEKTKNYKNLSAPTDVEANYLLNGKKAYKSNGTLVTGSIPIITAENKTLSSGENYTIPQGYHDGTGTVTAPSSSFTKKVIATSNTKVEHSFSVKDIPNYQSLTRNNFFLSNAYIYNYYGNDAYGNNMENETNSFDLIAYNASTGTVTVRQSSNYHSNIQYQIHYTLVCIY